MRRSTALGTGLVAGAAVIALAAAPALAQAGPWSRTATGSTAAAAACPGNGNGVAGTGTGRGMGIRNGNGTGSSMGMGNDHGVGNGMGTGMGNGTGIVSTAPKGTLTVAQQSALAAMAEEEKLAHDVYVALAARYPDVVQFSRIQRSETMHENAVRILLTRYGIADPTAGEATGTFTSTRLQGLYDTLVAGATTADKALAAGVTIEKTDIADLEAALKGLNAPDVSQTLAHLRTASERHLSAFGG